MKNVLGFLGYVLLVISAVFIDTPIIAILALPVFLTGFILVLIFYIKQIDQEKIYKFLPGTLIVAGVVILWLLLGYAAVEYNQFQGFLGRNPELGWNWNKIIIVVAINIVASILIFVGVKKGNNFNQDKVTLLILPTVTIIPVTIFLIKMYVLSGYWLGASI